MGIEPSSMLQYKPELYWKWYNVFNYTFYCDNEKDCLDEKNNVTEKYNTLTDDQKKEVAKENSKKIIKSVENDFGAKFIVSDSVALNNSLALNSDLIDDSFESKSDVNGTVLKVFKLK